LRDVGLGTSHVSFSAVPFVVWLQAPHPDRRAATWSTVTGRSANACRRRANRRSSVTSTESEGW